MWPYHPGKSLGLWTLGKTFHAYWFLTYKEINLNSNALWLKTIKCLVFLQSCMLRSTWTWGGGCWMGNRQMMWGRPSPGVWNKPWLASNFGHIPLIFIRLQGGLHAPRLLRDCCCVDVTWAHLGPCSMAPAHWSLPHNLHMPSEREWERFYAQEGTREIGEGWGRTDLDCLAALLGISQQLDGECPWVLQRLLEVDEAVAPVPAHCTLTTDGHRASVTVQMQHLGTREGQTLMRDAGRGSGQQQGYSGSIHFLSFSLCHIAKYYGTKWKLSCKIP